MSRKLRQIQVDIIDHIVASLLSPFRACAAWATMGSGKTASVYVALDRLHVAGLDVYPALVVAPLRVAKNTWPSEMADWPELLPDTRVVPIIGTAAERDASLHRRAEVYTINYENLPWLANQYEHKQWPFKTIVSDESTKLAGTRVSIQRSKTGKLFVAGQGSSRGKSLLAMSWKYRNFFIELTGTPATKGLEKLWGQLFFLDYGARLGRTFTAFEQRWYNTQRNADGYVKRIPFPHAQRQIEIAVSDICKSFDAAKYYDIAAPVTVEVWVDLPPDARKQYRAMEKDLFVKIKEHEIEAFNAGTKTGKLSQLANGAAYINQDTEEWVVVHDEKLDALESIVEEAAGMPVMVVYWFKSDLARLKERFKEGRVLDNKKSTEDAWNAGDIPVLFTHYESAGHGLNLQHGGNICAIFGSTWSLELYSQVIERIGPMRQMQSGYKRPVFVYQILARDTIDVEMMNRQATHKSVMDCLMDAVAARSV